MNKQTKPSKGNKTLKQIGIGSVAGGVGMLANGNFVAGLISVGVGVLLWGIGEYRDEILSAIQELGEKDE